MNDALEREIRELIVDALMLEDVRPDEIDPDLPLFGDGLGLDSIDALELVMAIDRRFGVKIGADDASARRVLHDVRSLAAHVRGAQGTP